MGIALIEKSIFEDMVRLSEAALHVAEFKRHGFLNIGVTVPRMDPLAFFGASQRLLNGKNRLQDFIFDVNISERLFGEALACRCDCRHGVAGEAHLVHRQCLFVLR